MNDNKKKVVAKLHGRIGKNYSEVDDRAPQRRNHEKNGDATPMKAKTRVSEQPSKRNNSLRLAAAKQAEAPSPTDVAMVPNPDYLPR